MHRRVWRAPPSEGIPGVRRDRRRPPGAARRPQTAVELTTHGTSPRGSLMSFQPVRASDAERERALEALRAHFAAGRLEAEEFEDRAALITKARDRVELRAALAGLPGNRRARSARAVARMDRALLRGHAVSWLAISTALIAAWALAGGGSFWPAVIVVPWAILL